MTQRRTSATRQQGVVKAVRVRLFREPKVEYFADLRKYVDSAYVPDFLLFHEEVWGKQAFNPQDSHFGGHNPLLGFWTYVFVREAVPGENFEQPIIQDFTNYMKIPGL